MTTFGRLLDAACASDTRTRAASSRTISAPAVSLGRCRGSRERARIHATSKLRTAVVRPSVGVRGWQRQRATPCPAEVLLRYKLIFRSCEVTRKLDDFSQSNSQSKSQSKLAESPLQYGPGWERLSLLATVDLSILSPPHKGLEQ